jgi:hypothetical protein
MKRWFGKLGIGSGLALVGIVALAAGALSLAFHHSSDAKAKRSAARNAPPWARGGAPWRGGPPWLGRRHFRRFSGKEILNRREKFHAALAKELGVSTEKVDKAFRDLLEKRLNQAVENGNLTSKQRDRILKCYDDPAHCQPPSGGPPMGGPGGFGPPGGGPGFGPPM